MVAEGTFVCGLAPMVRYSRLAFRVLCRRWGCDVAYTPMLMAESFTRSARARDADLTTNAEDRPLVMQFAAHDPGVFAQAAALVAGQCDGIDLNCGCPETWVCHQGDGAALLHHPELVADMLRQATMAIGGCAVPPLSVKLRKCAAATASDSHKLTVELARRAVHAGASVVAVHGRTRAQGMAGPVDLECIAAVKSALPNTAVLANGGIATAAQATAVRAATGVNGVLCGNGLLHNPALFMSSPLTSTLTTPPAACVQEWITLSTELGVAWCIAHRHLSWMTHLMHRSAACRRALNTAVSLAAALDHLEDEPWWPH